MKNIFVTIEQTDEIFGAYLDLLPGFGSVNRTLTGLIQDVYEGVEGHIRVSREDDDYIHPDFDGEYRLVFQFAEMPKAIKQIKRKQQKRELELA
jgi:predicted RNase H-like HicB family nuclease